MSLRYISAAHAINTHKKIIELSGGISGVKNLGNIESPLFHIMNDDYYPSFEEKLTHLVFCINKFHGFNDGNKRTSIALGTFFLIINDLEPIANKFVIEMENIAVCVADNLIEKEMLQEIIISILNEEDYNEQLKLKIIDALYNSAVLEENSLENGLGFYVDLF